MLTLFEKRFYDCRAILDFKFAENFYEIFGLIGSCF